MDIERRFARREYFCAADWKLARALGGLENRVGKEISVAIVAACLMAGCSTAGQDFNAMKEGAESVVAYHCDNGSGISGEAYFDKKKGLAMMALSIGLDLTGKALVIGPVMVGEVFFGVARVVFKIPEGGGPSEVTMFQDRKKSQNEEGLSEQSASEDVRRAGHCSVMIIDPKDGKAIKIREANAEDFVKRENVDTDTDAEK